MIKSRIHVSYIHQYNTIQNFANDIFVADYTEQTKFLPIKKSVEFFSANPPIDIDYFSIKNAPKMIVGGIKFNNSSFVYCNGKAKSQCEAVFFPSLSTLHSWILFCELKYSSKPLNNTNNLKKAIKQLFKTHYYYTQDAIITKTNPCYLIASLPMQSEPFANFSISPSFLIKLKSTRNIVLRMKNIVEIKNEKILQV